MSTHFIKIFQFLTILHLISPIIIIKIITRSDSEYYRLQIKENVPNIQADVKVNNKVVIPNFDDKLYLRFNSEPGEIEITIHTNLTSLKSMFIMNSADSIKIKTLDACITNLDQVFDGQNGVKSIDLSEFDISKATSFVYMFGMCMNLKEIKFGNYKTSSANNMKGMFSGCYDLSSLDLSFLDTSQVTDMSYLFNECNSLISLDLSSVITSKVKTMSNMFYYCTSLNYLQINNFDLSSVTDFSSMFYNCKTLNYLDLSNFKTLEAINLRSMFKNCNSLISLDLNSFMTSKVTTMYSMFYGCNSLQYINIDNFDTSSVTDMSFMFYDCRFLTSLNIRKLKGNSVLTTEEMFSGCYSLTSLDFDNFKPTKIESMKKMFYSCFNLKSLDLNTFDTSLTTDMEYMFYGCESLIYLNINNFNMQNVTSMIGMFRDCSSLTSLILSNFMVNEKTKYQNIFFDISENLIFCMNNDFYEKIKSDINNKKCVIRDNCIPNWHNKSRKLIYDNSGPCVEFCNQTEKYKYEYENKCYPSCPMGTTSMFNNYFLCEIFDEIKYEHSLNKTNNYKKNQDITTNKIIEVAEITLGIKAITTDINMNTNDNSKILENIITNINTNEDSKILEIIITDINFNTYDINKIKEEITITYNNNDDDYNKSKLEISSICHSNDFFDNKCTPYKYQHMIEIIREDIINGLMNDKIDDIIKNKIDFYKLDDNIKYQITSSFNQNNYTYDDISIIKLKECESILKDVNNIPSNETLIIFKYDYITDQAFIPLVGYEVFNPITKKILDLNKCKNTTIEIILPTNITNSESFKHDPNNNYYKDKCNSYPNEKGLDMTIYDRKKKHNDKNLSLCPENCDYINYNNESKKVLCECEPQFNSTLITLDKIINGKKLLHNFKNIKKWINIDVIKCYKKLMNLTGLKNNIGSYIIVSIILIYIIGLFSFLSKGFKSLTIKIDNIIIKYKTRIKSKNTTISNPPIKRNILINNQMKNKLKRSNVIKNRNLISNNSSANHFKSNNINRSLNLVNKNGKQNKKYQIDIKYSDTELNIFEHSIAQKNDHRGYAKIYFSLIKTRHPLLSSIIPNNDYNSKSIKICLFFFSFALNFIVIALFFNDETMHKILEDEGIFNFVYNLPKTIYSFIISFVINFIITKLSSSEKAILEIRKKRFLKEMEQSANKTKINLIIKFVLFFMISFIFLSAFWFYIGCFCVVYTNTQIYLLQETLISFTLSMVMPFVIYLFI